MKRGTIQRKSDTPRSYLITVGAGVIRRNRRDLVQLPANANEAADAADAPAALEPVEPVQPRYPHRDRAAPNYLKDYNR